MVGIGRLRAEVIVSTSAEFGISRMLALFREVRNNSITFIIIILRFRLYFKKPIFNLTL